MAYYTCYTPFIGDIPFKEWGLRLPTGDIWGEEENTDKYISQLDIFLQLFPKEKLNDTFVLTNVKLRSKNLRETSNQKF
jgi:hypothetical protein